MMSNSAPSANAVATTTTFYFLITDTIMGILQAYLSMYGRAPRSPSIAKKSTGQAIRIAMFITRTVFNLRIIDKETRPERDYFGTGFNDSLNEIFIYFLKRIWIQNYKHPTI